MHVTQMNMEREEGREAGHYVCVRVGVEEENVCLTEVESCQWLGC